MRKFILIIISIFLFSPLSIYAATNCSMSEDGKCSKGCYFSGTTCKLCEAGEYSDTEGLTQCKKCRKPNDAEFDGGITGIESDACPWTITCAENQYWDGTKCTSCDSDYHSKGATYKGKGPNGPEAHPEVCEPNIYKLTLEKNLPNQTDKTPLYSWVKYGIGFATSENATEWSATGPIKTPTAPFGLVFWGYNTASTPERGDTLFLLGYPINENIKTYFHKDTTLYSVWTALTYKVEFYNSNELKEPTFYNKECKMTEDCLAPTTFPQTPGMIFSHWVCAEGCSGQVKPGEAIPEPTKEEYTSQAGDKQKPLKLYPYYIKCPVGFYCASSTEAKPCPMGTTTANTGAVKESDCVIKRGTSGTKFCDKTGFCFNLPGSGAIKYE